MAVGLNTNHLKALLFKQVGDGAAREEKHMLSNPPEILYARAEHFGNNSIAVHRRQHQQTAGLNPNSEVCVRFSGGKRR